MVCKLDAMVCEAGFHRGKHIPRQLPIQVSTDFGMSKAVEPWLTPL